MIRRVPPPPDLPADGLLLDAQPLIKTERDKTHAARTIKRFMGEGGRTRGAANAYGGGVWDSSFGGSGLQEFVGICRAGRLNFGRRAFQVDAIVRGSFRYGGEFSTRC